MQTTQHDLNNIYDLLVENDYFTSQEIDLVTSINGYRLETLDDMTYARYSERLVIEMLQEDGLL